MKVTLAFQCELEDIPKTMCELLGNLKEGDIPAVVIDVQDAVLYTNENNISEALGSIDQARIQLSKIDQKLMDYSAILAGYVKTDADLKMGIHPEQNLEKEEIINDQADSSSESEPE